MQRWTYKQLCKLANQASSWVLFCRSVSNSSSHQTQDDTSELTYWEKGNCPDSENRQNQPSLECLLRVLQLCLAHIRDPRALIKETLPPCNWALIPARGNSIYVWNIYFLDNWHFGICYIYMSFLNQLQLYVGLNVSKRALKPCSTKPNVRPMSQFQCSLPQVLAGLSELPPVPLQQARGTFQELALSISLTILRLNSNSLRLSRLHCKLRRCNSFLLQILSRNQGHRCNSFLLQILSRNQGHQSPRTSKQ